ncbi:hypothetical protein AB0J14_04605 [Micromonospora arborensis]|uniref:hypothetical protein n=1 Tax=Micromonospora arborensis TaxID=2116518 RepID=UPI0033DAD9C6
MTGQPYTDTEIQSLLAHSPQLAEFMEASVTNAHLPAEPDDINNLRARAATAAFNAEALNAHWSAVVNDEIGGWAVSINGLGPLDGGRMAADLVMSRELAEHIAEVHNHRSDAIVGQEWSVRYPDGFVDGGRFTEAGARQRAAELGGEVVCRAVGPWTVVDV